MKIAVLGTGMVGQAHAGKQSELGHDVFMGTKDVVKTLAKTEPDSMGRPPVSVWLKTHPKVKLATFAGAAAHGELVIEALKGQAAAEELAKLENELMGKVLVDITNPLDFSKGYARLFTGSDDSVAEQIQKALPKTKVVKAFNTVNHVVQIDPASIEGGEHHLFIAGNDQAAKDQVTKLAKDYGWKNILDLGGIESARGMEMAILFWLPIMKSVGTVNFGYKIAT